VENRKEFGIFFYVFEQYFGKWYFIHPCLCTKIFLISTLFCNVLDWWRLLLLWCLLVEMVEIWKAEEREETQMLLSLTLTILPVFFQLVLIAVLRGGKWVLVLQRRKQQLWQLCGACTHRIRLMAEALGWAYLFRSATCHWGSVIQGLTRQGMEGDSKVKVNTSPKSSSSSLPHEEAQHLSLSLSALSYLESGQGRLAFLCGALLTVWSPLPSLVSNHS
jgi:hypothetical protein